MTYAEVITSPGTPPTSTTPLQSVIGTGRRRLRPSSGSPLTREARTAPRGPRPPSRNSPSIRRRSSHERHGRRTTAPASALPVVDPSSATRATPARPRLARTGDRSHHGTPRQLDLQAAAVDEDDPPEVQTHLADVTGRQVLEERPQPDASRGRARRRRRPGRPKPPYDRKWYPRWAPRDTGPSMPARGRSSATAGAWRWAAHTIVACWV